MKSFDDLTLAEMDFICQECLGGATFGSEDVDPLKMAGAVMFAFERRDQPGLTWADFMANTTMGAIRAFSTQMELDEMTANPTVGLPSQT